MSQYVFKLPDVGEGTTEAEIVAWHVGVGDFVEEDQPLVDVMTDKATVEITAPVSGRVRERNGEPGAMAPIGSTLIIFEIETSKEAPTPADNESAPGTPRPAPSTAVEKRSGAATGKVLASPAVRRRARELGVDLAKIGDGTAGRLTHAHLDAFLARAEITETVSQGAFQEVKIIGLRRRIAEQMLESKRRIPHFSYTEECDVSDLEDLRRHLNETSGKGRLTLLPFLVRALVRALPEFPQINATFDDEAGVLRQSQSVHVGIATQTPAGLVVPVLKHAERRDIWDIAREIARIAEAARTGKATREELSGGTITLTSLGPSGGVSHTPVINRPEVAIVGPNKIIERPVVREGAVVIRKMMNISSSFDHRIVDGYDAAQFIQRVRAMLEHPATIFL